MPNPTETDAAKVQNKRLLLDVTWLMKFAVPPIIILAGMFVMYCMGKEAGKERGYQCGYAEADYFHRSGGDLNQIGTCK